MQLCAEPSTRQRVASAKALQARALAPASLSNLPTEVKTMIVGFVVLDRKKGTGLTAAARKGLKGLCLVDGVFRTLAQPYLFQALRCCDVILEGLLFLHKDVLPRFRTNVTSLLFQRISTAHTPTKSMRQAVSRITGTTQADRDGEECFSAMMASIIPLLPHLTSVAFDFHAKQPRTPDPFQGRWSSDRTPVEPPKVKPRADNADLVLAPLLAVASRITSLDICLDGCPQSDYGALADFLAPFRKLRTLRLADPPELRHHKGWHEPYNEIGRSHLLNTINSLRRLRSLSFVHLTELMDNNLVRLVPSWTLQLTSLTIVEADDLSIESIVTFIDSFGATLESLTLAQCPRTAVEGYVESAGEPDAESIYDEDALEDSWLALPHLRSLTLGDQFNGAEILRWFPNSPLRDVTIGETHFSAEDYSEFMEEHEGTLATVRLRLHDYLDLAAGRQLQKEARKLDIVCEVVAKEPDVEDFSFHWPVNKVYA